MRRTVLAFAMVSTIAILMLAQPISALTSALAASNDAGNDLDSGGKSGLNNGRQCPNCGNLMKLCPPTSEYKWICHGCGCFVLR
jgi:hypothetical protein